MSHDEAKRSVDEAWRRAERENAEPLVSFHTRGGAGSWLGLDVKRKVRGKKEEYYKKARKKEGGLLLQIRR